MNDDRRFPPRDDRLLAALRHAPDCDAVPPSALAASIAAAARAAVAQRAGPSKPLELAAAAGWRRRVAQGWREWLDQLAGPRPVWAGGAAALLVSVLTVSMWHDEPIPPAVVNDAPPAASPSLDGAHEPAPMKATTPSADTRKAESGSGPAPAHEASINKHQGQTPEAPADLAKQQDQPRQRERMADSADLTAPAKAQAPVPAPVPAPTPAAPSVAQPSTARAPATAATTANAADGTQRDRANPGVAELAEPSPPVQSAAGTGAPATAAETHQGSSAFPGAELRRQSPGGPQRLGAAAPVPRAPPGLAALIGLAGLDARQRQLLQRVDELGRGRWQQLSATAATGNAPPVQLRTWSLETEGAAQVALHLEANGLRWIEPDGGAWFIPLERASVDSLQALPAPR